MEITCPKCGSAMTEGARVDMTGKGITYENWLPSSGFPKILFKPKKTLKLIKVSTYACNDCGYLESYLKKRS